ncbi:hypothetical protein F2Q68_00025900 [Brassica cretica]|uniref:Uncharacterized protein n=1 Tax=Brassica cretica TaxID=69181 RepID=A0A8S9IA15_BRACR|nr:hypothetical protein F2Q68_00025900 [Brassica cretica]
MDEEKRERERGTKRESLVVKSGVRRSVGAIAGARFFQIKSTGPCLLLVSSGFRLSELWSASNRRGSVPGVTTRLREGWRGQDISSSSSISGRRRLSQIRRRRSFGSVAGKLFQFRRHRL